MIGFEREIADATERQLLPATLAPHLAGAERREPFSVYVELRLVAWAAVMLITTGVGIVVKNNLDRIGPLAIALVLGAAAAGFLAWAAWRKKHDRSTAVDEYLVLLGALLVSADIAFVESQFKLFDAHWQRHLLLIAVIHAVIAYAFDSRSVLTLSIASLAAWIGVQQKLGYLVSMRSLDFAIRSLACAAAMLVWREADRRLRTSRSFEPVFEHLAANFAFFACIGLMLDRDPRVVGCLLALVIAGFMLRYAFRARREAFAIYAAVYGVIAIDTLVIEVLSDGALGLLFIVFSTIGAIVALFAIHARFRDAGDDE